MKPLTHLLRTNWPCGTSRLTEWRDDFASFARRSTRAGILIILLIWASALQAQQAAFLQIKADTFPKALSEYRQTIAFADSSKARDKLLQAQQKLQKDGFLLANIDTSYWQTDTLKAQMYVGQPWSWASIQADSSAQEVWDKLNLGKTWAKQQAGASLGHSTAYQALVQTVEYYENHGFPFAKARWKTQMDSPNRLHGYLQVDKGTPVAFDTLRMQGGASVDNRFLRRYLGLRKGTPFSQKALDRAKRQLQQMPYLQLKGEIRAAFVLGQAYPLLKLEPSPSSRLNGVVGILFDPQRQSRPVLTGDLSILLSNPFRHGREISLEYRRLKEASQRFGLSYKQPALLGTRFDVAGQFSYQLEDSTFANLSWALQFGYRLPAGGRLLLETKVFDRRVDSRIAENPQAFPDLGSTQYRSYGLGFEGQNIDNFLFPKQGWKINLMGRVGNKQLRPLLSSQNDNYDSLYAGVPEQQVQVQWEGSLEKYWYIKPPLGLLLRGQGAGVIADWRFLNDLLRVGGLNSLRGFNEQEFFASNYFITTLEARFHFSSGGYFAVFFDQAYLHQQIRNQAPESDWPLGVGAELAFRTKAGIFRFAYAAGQSQGQPLDFRTAKVHFGLTSLF